MKEFERDSIQATKMACCSNLRDLEACEAKICCLTKGFCDNFNCCQLPCMTKNCLRKIVIFIGILYLIISFLPVSYYIIHNIIPKVLLQDPSDLKDLQQLSTLSIEVLIILLINFILNLIFLWGVEVKLARQSFLLTWLVLSIVTVVLCGIGIICLTFMGLGKIASIMLERKKATTTEANGDIKTDTNMTSSYVFLGFVFLVISSLVITFCSYSIIVIVRMYKRRIKNQQRNQEGNNSLEQNEYQIEADELINHENALSPRTSIAFSPEPDANVNPKCSEFFGVCCCLIFEDLPGCAEMCLAAIRGKCSRYCDCSCESSCVKFSLHSQVKLIVNITLTISILAIVLYISSALNSMTTFMLPVFTILHLIFIGLLVMGAMKQKRSYLLPWMIFSWISWLGLLPCIFGSFSSTKEWKITFQMSWIIASVSTYFAFNFIFWIIVKKFYACLIQHGKKKSLEKKKLKLQTRGKKKKTTSECSSLTSMQYHNPIPQIQVYDSEDNIDEADKVNSAEEERPLEPIMESDVLDHSSSNPDSGEKLKITADVAVAAIAIKRSNDHASVNRNKPHEENSIHATTQAKKAAMKLKTEHDQRMPGMIHVPGAPKLSNLASPKMHHSPRDKHGGRNLEGRKGHGHGKGMKGMRGGGRHGGMDRLDRATARNNNYEKSDSKDGELFDFIVDVGGILDDQFDQYNDEKDEFGPNKSKDDSGSPGGDGGSRKGRRQRAGSATAFLMVADDESHDKLKDKKLEMARNKKLHARSATNLTSSYMNEYSYGPSPSRKKSSNISDQACSSTSITKRHNKKESPHQKIKMPKSKTRR